MFIFTSLSVLKKPRRPVACRRRRPAPAVAVMKPACTKKELAELASNLCAQARCGQTESLAEAVGARCTHSSALPSRWIWPAVVSNLMMGARHCAAGRRMYAVISTRTTTPVGEVAVK